MIFGGTSDDTVIAETTLGKHVILQQNNTMCSITGYPPSVTVLTIPALIVLHMYI